jgi:hypothetical protein
MRKNKSTLIWIIVLVLVAVSLFLVPVFTNPYRELIADWKDNDIDCLPQGHTRLAEHFHPSLTVVVDGEEEVIPANIGIVSACMAELHTHDTTGVIHAETASARKEFRLGQFFGVWGKSLERAGYSLEAVVDGEAIENPAEIILEDGQQIVLEYMRLGN